MARCDACSKEVAASSLEAHREDCPDVEISCAHEANGCPWKGPRYQAAPHLHSCAYEAIKGFFAVHDRKVAALTEDNILLRHKLGVLDGIVVSEMAYRTLLKSKEQDLSLFKAGEWLVDTLCLIPIHLAVARDNRFIPLKDGVWSPDQERALLGATVDQVIDNLSFGWYESIFQSYMASKVCIRSSLCC